MVVFKSAKGCDRTVTSMRWSQRNFDVYQNQIFMKKILQLSIVLAFVVGGCDLEPPVNPNVEHQAAGLLKKYPGDLAVKWNKLQLQISRVTPGFNTGLAVRAFAYSGLTLYESMVEAIPWQRSVASKLIGEDINRHNCKFIHWAASGNAAMAYAVKNLIPTASAASKARIDSLENAFADEFKTEVPQNDFDNSVAYGRGIAQKIVDWSKTDGVAEAAAKNASYVIPVGEGLWKPTPPAFAFPVNVYASETRTFVKNSPTLTLAPPPIPYSNDPNSAFFKQVKFVYDYSQHLTADEINIVKTWGEFPGNFTQGLRYTTIAIQLIDEADLPLVEATIAFAKHNMAIHEAGPCVFNSKYKYNYVRPITYIQDVMGFTSWTALNPTPPHPEYPSAHACVGRASSRIMEIVLGKHYAFTDKTHESTWGVRSYDSPKAYSDESGWSRVLGGIHYVGSMNAGRDQGEKVGNLINDLFKPGNGK